MKLLITGASGFLGKALFNYFSKDDDVIGLGFTKGDFDRIDITDKADLIKALDDIKPDVIIHSAAMSNADECEKDPSKANMVNVEATKNIVEYCRENAAFLVFISTDLVFDGEKGDYDEDDMPNPVNVYGETKFEGEKAVAELVDYLIVRTSAVYDFPPTKGFVKFLVESAKDGKKIEIIDAINSPTYLEDIPKVIKLLLKLGKTGIFHVAGPQKMSKMEMAKAVYSKYGADLDKLIQSDEKLGAARPKDSSLNIDKIRNLGIVMRNVGEVIK